MQANISDQITSGTFSKVDDDGKISGQRSIFAAIALLMIVLLLCAVGTGNDPSLLLPQPTFVGP